jgi:hypothetical protein
MGLPFLLPAEADEEEFPVAQTQTGRGIRPAPSARVRPYAGKGWP